MTDESQIRLSILKEVTERKEPLIWQDTLYNDIATELLTDQCVQGDITDGGTACVTGIRDKGRRELELATLEGKAKRLARKLPLLLWAVIVAVFVYILQLESVRSRLSDLVDSVLK